MLQQDIGLSQYIAVLEEDESRLQKELDEIRIAKNHALRIREENSIPPPGTTVLEDTTKPYRGMGNESAVLKLLSTSTSGPMKTSDISNTLEKGGLESEAKNLQANIFGTLRRLSKKGSVTKIGDGRRTRWAAWKQS